MSEGGCTGAARVEGVWGGWVECYRDSRSGARFLAKLVVTGSGHAIGKVYKGACSVRQR